MTTMINRLIHGAGGGGISSIYNEARGNGVVQITSTAENPMREVIIEGGDLTLYHEYVIPGIGEVGDSGTLVRVRVHGEAWIDGTELARIMRATKCASYVGEYDSKHFIIRPSLGPSYLTTPYHMKTRSAVYSFYAQALISEDIGEASRASGLYFEYINNTTSAVKLASGSVGTQKLSCTSSMNTIYGIVARPVADNFDLVIPYDSVFMREGKDNTPLPYDGYTLTFPLERPLFALNTSGKSDKLSALDGTVQREVGVFTIDSDTNIQEGYYEGRYCYYVDLKSKGVPGSAVSSAYFNVDATFGEPRSIAMSADGDKLLFFAEEEISFSEFKSLLIENRVNIIYPLAEPYIENIGVTLPKTMSPGTHYIEVCSIDNAPITVKYVS